MRKRKTAEILELVRNGALSESAVEGVDMYLQVKQGTANREARSEVARMGRETGQQRLSVQAEIVERSVDDRGRITLMLAVDPDDVQLHRDTPERVLDIGFLTVNQIPVGSLRVYDPRNIGDSKPRLTFMVSGVLDGTAWGMSTLIVHGKLDGSREISAYKTFDARTG